MDYKIIVDSAGEFTSEMKESGVFTHVPLTIDLDGKTIRDDETFDQQKFLKMVQESEGGPKSSCPSPGDFATLYKGQEKRVYVVTLSSLISGTHNSATLGKSLYEEEFGPKQIHIFNSKSAVVGETLVALKIWECEQAGKSFEEVVDIVEAFIEKLNTYFVLESLDVLIKTGRLTGVKQVMASALNIKPIMGASKEGNLMQLGKARGIKKAIPKMVELIVEQVEKPEEKILAIAHCNCYDRALEVQSMIQDLITVKASYIVDTAAIGTMYASQGGIVVAI